MRIIISPAKKMKINTDLFPCRGIPEFYTQTGEILEVLQGFSYDELKKVWGCSESLARMNFERIAEMDLNSQLTPAIISYEGIQYQYMAPEVFSEEAYGYLQEKLRILSGFYGILKPFDGVRPYRLEMQARIGTEKINTLYDFWGDRIAINLFRETDTILNLASKEYSKCITDYLNGDIRFITCVFGELVNGKVKEKGTMVKMARGEMVRYMAENQVENIEDIRKFDRLGYSFSQEHSDENTYVYIKQEA